MVNPDHVQAFRDYVDEVVEGSNAAKADNLNRGILDDGTTAEKDGLTFMSVDPSDESVMSPTGFDRARLWSIQTAPSRFAGNVGQMTLISTVDAPDVLMRRWTFDSPLDSPIGVNSERPLDDSEAEAAVAWAKSPSENPEAQAIVASMSETEAELVETEMTQKQAVADTLHATLEEMASQRHQAYADSANMPIGY